MWRGHRLVHKQCPTARHSAAQPHAHMEPLPSFFAAPISAALSPAAARAASAKVTGEGGGAVKMGVSELVHVWYGKRAYGVP